ncbi:MAG TPA: hypothetical protein VFW65_36580 [Pseudonocardiaceae bacterium]|nr:hypothetical protein [Pseudonocardiaceae bacterium]
MQGCVVSGVFAADGSAYEVTIADRAFGDAVPPAEVSWADVSGVGWF